MACQARGDVRNSHKKQGLCVSNRRRDWSGDKKSVSGKGRSRTHWCDNTNSIDGVYECRHGTYGEWVETSINFSVGV